jgi:hypothetical protein
LGGGRFLPTDYLSLDIQNFYIDQINFEVEKLGTWKKGGEEWTQKTGTPASLKMVENW